MFLFIRTIRLFLKYFSRIATSLEAIHSLYKLDLASRGITPLTPGATDETEVVYGYQEPAEE